MSLKKCTFKWFPSFKKMLSSIFSMSFLSNLNCESFLLAGLNCIRGGVTHCALAQWHTPCQKIVMRFGASLIEGNRFLRESWLILFFFMMSLEIFSLCVNGIEEKESSWWHQKILLPWGLWAKLSKMHNSLVCVCSPFCYEAVKIAHLMSSRELQGCLSEPHCSINACQSLPQSGLPLFSCCFVNVLGRTINIWDFNVWITGSE